MACCTTMLQFALLLLAALSLTVGSPADKPISSSAANPKSVGPGGAYPVYGGYPPQYGGYPPQYGGYPPQYGGYPPQYGGYPPQYGGYPPVQPYPMYPPRPYPPYGGYPNYLSASGGRKA